MERPALLVVDDRDIDRKLVERALTPVGYDVTTAASGREAIELIKSRPFDAAIVDLRIPGIGGLELLRRIKEHDPVVDVVVMTADPTVDTAVEALKRGAYDYIGKPLNPDELQPLVARLLEQSLRRREVKSLRTGGQALVTKELTGASAQMAKLKELVGKVAPTNSSVLIEGESGTGKELVAAAIHRRSARAKGPFIPVNCGAIPENLLELEFFGHVRGAFSGAVSDAHGLFRSAHGGTIFLDLLADLSASLQTKLLRVLEDNEVRPVGSTKKHTVDVRVVAATNRPLETDVRKGRFRQDLFYRINVIRIVVPPLRERRSDVPALVHQFVRQFNARFNRRVKGVTTDAMTALRGYDFPGNVRELENLMERAFALGAHDKIHLEDLPTLTTGVPVVPATSLETPPAGKLPPLNAALARVERELILKALQLHGGDREKAARALSISARTLYRRLKEHSHV